uniref:glutathione transferase n=1 Tax=Rhizophora mucronata TaxID=61149 RepID=A0A2P2MM40_RHIMU
MAEERIVLLDWDVSPFAARVRIALREKGLEYETKEEDLSNKSPLLLQMNPVKKQVPVLIHNGKPICESIIIVQYIDEVWDHKSPLLPSDPHHKASARFWADCVDKKIYPLARRFWSSEGADEGSIKELIDNFKIFEQELGDKPYFGGQNLGLVDLTLLPYWSFFPTFEKIGGLSMEAECPKIEAWANRCIQEKESVSKSLCDPNRVYEAISGIRK